MKETILNKGTILKRQEDLDFLLSMKHIKAEKKFDIRGKKYPHVSEKPKKTPDGEYVKGTRAAAYKAADPEHRDYPIYLVIYDNCFNILYNNHFSYTLVLKYINDRQTEYGYLCPMSPSIMAKKLDMPLHIIMEILHSLSRSSAIFIYQHNIMRIQKTFTQNRILKTMMNRHPSKTTKKPLGYQNTSVEKEIL